MQHLMSTVYQFMGESMSSDSCEESFMNRRKILTLIGAAGINRFQRIFIR